MSALAVLTIALATNVLISGWYMIHGENDGAGGRLFMAIVLTAMVAFQFVNR